MLTPEYTWEPSVYRWFLLFAGRLVEIDELLVALEQRLHSRTSLKNHPIEVENIDYSAEAL